MGADPGGEFFRRRRRRRRRRRHWTPWRGFIENVLFSKKKSIFGHILYFRGITRPRKVAFQIWVILIGLTTENTKIFIFLQ